MGRLYPPLEAKRGEGFPCKAAGTWGEEEGAGSGCTLRMTEMTNVACRLAAVC